MAIGTDSNINIVAGLPPEAGENELCAIDLEIFGIPEGKIHRPVGTFACASVFLERDMDGVNYTDNIPVYQVYDPHDLPALVERIGHGRWVFQNGAFDIRQMRRWAEIRPRKIWDTMVVDQGLWGGYYSSFDLASLSLRYLHEYMAKDVREDFSTATEMTPEMKLYAAQDPVTTLRVALAQMDYIAESGRTMHHYWKADHPAIWAILDMPAVRVSAAGWEELGRDFEAKRDALDALYPGINLGSTQQVNARICELMGRKNLYKSVDEDHLLEILDEAQQKGRDRAAAFVRDVLARRKYATYASRYGFNWIANYLEDGEWVNAHWKAVQALTGRLACGDPNLMQIPSREFPIYRSFFTASDGGVILVADVAQQEPRITAKLSMDKHLVEAVRAGESTHVVTGRRIYHDESFSKASPLYNVAKQVNLGLSYGMTARGLAQKTGLSIDEAQEVVDAYFVAFPGVKSYMHKYRQMAYRQGYVETLLGRRSYINPYSRKWENNAINSPIQGSAADQMKIAMGFVHQESKARGLPFCLSMVVHDEMVCDVPKEIEPEYRQLIEDAWQHAGRLTLGDTVPIVIEMASGPHWGCKH